MRDVRRYTAEIWRDGGDSGWDSQEVVLASDYDALDKRVEELGSPWVFVHHKPGTFDYPHNYGDCGGDLQRGCGFDKERARALAVVEAARDLDCSCAGEVRHDIPGCRYRILQDAITAYDKETK